MKTKSKKHVLFYNIDWDTDGEETTLPKKVKIKLVDYIFFDKDLDFEMRGADYLSDNFGWCVNSFEFKTV
jgi:hypothetical protein